MPTTCPPGVFRAGAGIRPSGSRNRMRRGMKMIDELSGRRDIEGVWRPQRGLACLALLALAGLVAGCGRQEPGGEPPSAPPEPAAVADSGARRARAAGAACICQPLGEFNRGAALLEQYNYSAAAKAFEAVAETPAGLGRRPIQPGPGLLEHAGRGGEDGPVRCGPRRPAGGIEAEPQAVFTPASASACTTSTSARTPRPWSVFEAVARHDPRRPGGDLQVRRGPGRTGPQRRGDPGLRADDQARPGVHLRRLPPGLALSADRPGGKGRSVFERFKDLNAVELTGGMFTVQDTYGMAGKYYLALGADSLPLPRPAPAARRRILFSPDVEAARRPRRPRGNGAAGPSALPGLAAGDLSGHGRLDLVHQRGRPRGQAPTSGSTTATAISRRALPSPRRACRPAWATWTTPATWTSGWARRRAACSSAETARATSCGGPRPACPPRPPFTVCTRLLDIDSDGDLDLLAFRLEQGLRAGGRRRPARRLQRLPQQSRRHVHGHRRAARAGTAGHAGGRGGLRRFRQRPRRGPGDLPRQRQGAHRLGQRSRGQVSLAGRGRHRPARPRRDQRHLRRSQQGRAPRPVGLRQGRRAPVRQSRRFPLRGAPGFPRRLRHAGRHRRAVRRHGQQRPPGHRHRRRTSQGRQPRAGAA